jgi:subtilisin family serine protease
MLLTWRSLTLVPSVVLRVAAVLAAALILPQAAHAAPQVIDAIVVKFNDVAPTTEAVPSQERQMQLAKSVQSGFASMGRTRDGAYRFALNPPLPLDEARALLTRVRSDSGVLYANFSSVQDALNPSPRLREKNGSSRLTIFRFMVKYRDPALQANASANLPLASPQLAHIAAVAGQPVAHDRVLGGGEYLVDLMYRITEDQAVDIAAALEADPGIEYADPDWPMFPMLVPNDTLYAQQWHYQSGAGGANLPGAWSLTTGVAGVNIAVIDTGILSGHPDLAGKFVGGYDFVHEWITANDGQPVQPGGCLPTGNPNNPPCVSDRDPDPNDPGDWLTIGDNNGSTYGGWLTGCGVGGSSFHGSHVAGTIAAATNNGSGVAGINWVGKVVPHRVLGRCGGYTSDIVDAVYWSVNNPVAGLPANPNPARVLNLSLGGKHVCSASEQSAYNAALAAGAVVAVAAGNSNDDASLYSPSSCNGVITVGANQGEGAKAYYGNYGASLEITAPGGGKRVPPNQATFDLVLSTLNSGIQIDRGDGVMEASSPDPAGYNYVGYQGTSMATPHIAGISSLVLSRDPSLTPSQVLAKLTSTARAFPTIGTTCDTTSNPRPPSSSWFSCQCTTGICGAGIVDATAAVTATVPPSPTLRKGRDFDGNGRKDILWRDASSGATQMWTMYGPTASATATLLTNTSWVPTHTGFFDADNNADILWRNTATGDTTLWFMNGTNFVSGGSLLVSPVWSVTHVADFNGDGKADLLWHNSSTGATAMWLLNGGLTATATATLLTSPNWNAIFTGDFNGDGKADIVWYNNATGETAIWLMNGTTFLSGTVVLANANWHVVAVADFNGDGKDDLLWRNASTGETAIWLMNGTTMTSGAIILTNTQWVPTLTGDFNGDGKADLVFYNASTGQTALWLMNGVTMTSGAIVLTNAQWQAAQVADVDGDGMTDIIWNNTVTGAKSLWTMNGLARKSGNNLPIAPTFQVVP